MGLPLIELASFIVNVARQFSPHPRRLVATVPDRRGVVHRERAVVVDTGTAVGSSVSRCSGPDPAGVVHRHPPDVAELPVPPPSRELVPFIVRAACRRLLSDPMELEPFITSVSRLKTSYREPRSLVAGDAGGTVEPQAALVVDAGTLAGEVVGVIAVASHLDIAEGEVASVADARTANRQTSGDDEVAERDPRARR